MKKYIIIPFLFISICTFSQTYKIKKANDNYESLSYIDAIKVYEKVAKKGNADNNVYEKLGNAYYFNADYVKAGEWYSKLFEDANYQNAEIMYRYSQSLKSSGDYTKANVYLEKFSKLNPQDERSISYNTNKNYLDKINEVSNRGVLENAGINSELSDYGAFIYDSVFVFTSNRKNPEAAKNIHSWTNEPFSDIYQASIDDDFNLSNVKILKGKTNSKFNESSAIFTKDGKTMYFTRNNYITRKDQRREYILLKIYKATFDGETWTDIEELPFNSNDYNCAHPTLSLDEKTLYFASDMPGGFGSSDIYKVAINKDKTFGTPENLGKNINTKERESFPYISESGILYFSSDGHLGLGGLDIFAVKLKNIDSREVLNIGKPLNSEFDDFAYLIRNKKGFLSSNRENDDNIYKFLEEVPLPIDCNNIIKGTVKNSRTNELISDAKMVLLDAKLKEIETVMTNINGFYSFSELDCSTKYYVRVITEKFETTEKSTTTPKTTGETFLDFDLTPRLTKIKEDTDLAKEYDIENIYFDLDKSNITEEAEKKLNILLAILEEYPTIKIDIRSHTDSRASASYNINLSNRRAKSTMNWLIQKGINANRLTSKGYGETQLVNGCSDGVKCTEEQHQANRRSEFIIVK